jgi:hypothetical protein
MIVWLWIGGGVVGLGTLVALAPSLRRRTRPPLEARPALTEPPEHERIPADEAVRV